MRTHYSYSKTPILYPIRVLTPHRPDCPAVRSWPANPWSYPHGVEEHNIRGVGRGQHDWHRVECEGLDCPGAVLVNLDWLGRLIQAEIENPVA